MTGHLSMYVGLTDRSEQMLAESFRVAEQRGAESRATCGAL